LCSSRQGTSSSAGTIFLAVRGKTQQSNDKSKTTPDGDLLMLKVKAIQLRKPAREITQ